MLSPQPFAPEVADPNERDLTLPLSLRRQGVLDLATRMRNGLLIYPAVWVILMQVDGFAQRHPEFAWGHAAALTLITLVRLHFNHTLASRLDGNFDQTQQIIRLLSVVHNLYWGVLCAVILSAPDAENLRWLMLTTTVGITAGGTVIVSIDAVLPMLYPLCTLSPTVLALLPQGGSTNLAISGLAAVCFAYSLGVSRLVGKDYWENQRSQAMLEQRARELEALSRTDALTQVPNRLRFQERLSQSWRDARRRREPLAIAMVDLDHFKKINDSYGHPCGDRCLQAAAQALTETARRPFDLVARYGGEEFVVLMPNTDLSGALQVAEKMLAQIRQTHVFEGDHDIALSCSIGVSVITPSVSHDEARLVQEADAALYHAKQHGRARVSVHGAPAQLAH